MSWLRRSKADPDTATPSTESAHWLDGGRWTDDNLADFHSTMAGLAKLSAEHPGADELIGSVLLAADGGNPGFFVAHYDQAVDEHDHEVGLAQADPGEGWSGDGW